MRHLWTVIAAVVIAPVTWILLSFGQDRSAEAFTRGQGGADVATGDFVRPALCLAAAGLLFGLIATLRFSPLGAVLTGLGYASGYLLLLLDPDRMLNLAPGTITVAGRSTDLITPVQNGTALLVGALLLVAILSVGRWRRWPGDDDEPDGGLRDVLDPEPGFGRTGGAGSNEYDMSGWSAREPDPAPEYAEQTTSPNIGQWVGSLRGGRG